MDHRSEFMDAPSGWSILKNIHLSSNSFVFKDHGNLVIKGLKYNIATTYSGKRKSYHFDFETWTYGARGAVQLTSLLSFDLAERVYPDPWISGYLSNIKILKRHGDAEHIRAPGILKAARDFVKLIDHDIRTNGFDVLEYHKLVTADYNHIPAGNTNIPFQHQSSGTTYLTGA